MKKNHSVGNTEFKVQRVHCPDCGCYLDDALETCDEVSDDDLLKDRCSLIDRIMQKMFPGFRMSPYPGMQFRRYSQGTIYDRIGFYIPCRCSAGAEVHVGYKKKEGNQEFNYNRKRMDETYHRIQKAA